jgi:hypothetical protein
VCPCHHGMADGGGSQWMWREAANILNKQFRTADKGWSVSLNLGEGLTTPRLKKPAYYEMLYGTEDEKCIQNFGRKT